MDHIILIAAMNVANTLLYTVLSCVGSVARANETA